MAVNFEIVDLLLVGPAAVIFLASLIPLSLKAFGGGREPKPMLSVLYALIGLTLSAGIAFSNYGIRKAAFSNALVFDGMSSWATLLIIFTAAFGLILARESIATSTRQFSETVFLLLNASVGMMLVAWSNDLIMLFIGIEVMSLCLYLAIALSLEERRSKEAAFKYFVLGSFASAIFLYGVSFVYGTSGATYFAEIAEVGAEVMSTNRLFLFGVVMIFVGLSFKVATFPFHSWAPDVYQGSPTPLTAYMAAGVKIAIFVAFLRLMGTHILLGDRAGGFLNAIQWLAVLTMMVGNIAAIMQTNLKRMLAYSSVAHSGYILIGILCAGVGEEGALGATGVLLYVLGYTVMTFGSFGILSLLERDENSEIRLEDLRGMGSRQPFLAFCLALFLMSLAGLPPTIGFFGKFYLFSAAIRQGFYWVAFWGVLSSAVSVYYYLRPIVNMYMAEGKELELVGMRMGSRLVVFVCAISVVLLGVFANPFYDIIRKSVAGLF